MDNKIEKKNTMWTMRVWTYIFAVHSMILYGDFYLNEIIKSAYGTVTYYRYEKEAYENQD